MPGCTIVFGEMGQLAQNAAIGIAAICGNNGALPAVAAEVAVVSNDGMGIHPPAAGHAVAAAAPPPPLVDSTLSESTQENLPAETNAVQQVEAQSLTGGYVFFGTACDNMAQSASDTLAGSTNVDLLSSAQQAHSTTYPTAGSPDADADQASADWSEDILTPTEADEASVAKAADAPGGGLQLNAGYSSIEGIAVGGKITRTNIFGPGTEVGASASYSKVRTAFELGYNDSDFLGSKYAFAPTLFADRVSSKNFGKGLRFAPFRQSARGLNILFNRKFDNGLSAVANYRLSRDSFQITGKNVNCDSAIYGSALCGTIGDTTSSILSFALTYEQKNQSPKILRGFRLRAAQDLSIGGTASFIRYRLNSEALIALGDGWDLSLDVAGGYIRRVGNDKIPLFDRFYIGNSSIRGFDLRGFGPKIRPTGAQAGETVGIGGRAYYVARAELSAPLNGRFGIHGVRPGIFIDAGSVFAADRSGFLAGEQLLGNSAKPRISVGIGVSMNTPMGKLRLDVARPISKQPGDRGKMLSISFGAAI